MVLRSTIQCITQAKIKYLRVEQQNGQNTMATSIMLVYDRLPAMCLEHKALLTDPNYSFGKSILYLIDLQQSVNSFHVYTFSFTVCNLSSNNISVKFLWIKQTRVSTRPKCGVLYHIYQLSVLYIIASVLLILNEFDISLPNPIIDFLCC